MHKFCRGCLFTHLLKASPKGHPTIGRNVSPGDTQKSLKQLPLATSGRRQGTLFEQLCWSALSLAWCLQARDLLGLSADDTPASQPAEPAAPGPVSSSEANSANGFGQGAHARNFSFFQPFQSGMQQASHLSGRLLTHCHKVLMPQLRRRSEHRPKDSSLYRWLHSRDTRGSRSCFGCVQGAPGRRPSTAESPGRNALSRSGAALSLARPASAASESSMTYPALSPCGALVAKAVQEANREGAGQVWQPLASRQLDSWAATSAPAHTLSAPAQSLQHVPSLPHQVSHRHTCGRQTFSDLACKER